MRGGGAGKKVCSIMEQEACIHVPMRVYIRTHVYVKTPVIKTSKEAVRMQLKAKVSLVTVRLRVGWM